ncbi:MAG: hypothetical protein AAGJ31_06750, partial [Verrucomicrobiota bacterium]
AKTPWPTVPGSFSFNIDPGPTKQWMRLNQSPQNKQAFGRRLAEELYDLRQDPDQLTNLLAADDVSVAIEGRRRALAVNLSDGLRESGDPRFAEPHHATFEIQGWTIHLHDSLLADSAEVTNRMLALLHIQLERVVDVVPTRALAQIRQIPIWINPPYEGKRPTAEYHTEAEWLKDHGRNPSMVRSVEITNVKIFPFEDRRMPYLLLHELAHGYHDRILPGGYRNENVREAYHRARESGSYDEVPRFNGNRTIKDKAYGMANPMEYFAESTEAYFGRNDFFPFNREELKQHDPGMHDLVQELWGASP